MSYLFETPLPPSLPEVEGEDMLSGELVFPPSGIGDEAFRMIKRFQEKNRIRRETVNEFYEPFIEPEIAQIQSDIAAQGHDLFSAFCYEGTATYIDKSIRAAEREFMGWQDVLRGGTILPTGTIALQHA